MKWTLAAVVFLMIGPHEAGAERALSPADATVFVRLVGSVHAEFDEPGSARQSIDLDRIEIGTGSGFVISPHGYVLTNEHVISNSDMTISDGLRTGRISLKVARIDVCFSQGAADALGGASRCFPASVHSADAALDLAVLFISVSELPYVALGDSDVVRNGQRVSALGYPFGRELEVGRVAAPDLVPEVSTSPGTISAVRGDDAGTRSALQINGTVNPGNSGGPVIDENGYVVGVVRARVKGDAGIGFAIPINHAKDFLESHGLDPLMPAHRMRLGAFESLGAKGIALRLPDGVSDTSPFRSRVEGPPEPADVALRIDRSVSPWTVRQLERTLLQTDAFERVAIENHESQIVPRPPAAPLLVGRATGAIGGGGPATAMIYGILEMGDEKLIARYVGSAEQLAYNEGVLRMSLLSLDGRRLISAQSSRLDNVEWVTAPGSLNLPLPAGWVVEPGTPSSCAGLPQPSAVAAAYPTGDVTLALRVASWGAEAVSDRQAAASCSARVGASGGSSYMSRAEWLGVAYVIEGAFVRVGARVLQLEVISSDRRAAAARPLFAAWVAKITSADGAGAR